MSTTEPISPCTRNCCLDNKDVCVGCFRTLNDILLWGEATDKVKISILANSQRRKLEYLKD